MQSQRFVPPLKQIPSTSSNLNEGPKKSKNVQPLERRETRSPTLVTALEEDAVALSPDIGQKKYRSEATRLETFQSWRFSNPKPAEMANAGFIYTGKINFDTMKT